MCILGTNKMNFLMVGYGRGDFLRALSELVLAIKERLERRVMTGVR